MRRITGLGLPLVPAHVPCRHVVGTLQVLCQLL